MAPQLEPERWKRVQDLFHEASEMSASARPAFLQEACGGDPELRREVESLLASLDDNQDLIGAAIQQGASDVVQARSADGLKPGGRFGQYEIVLLLGSGGMGRVYLARDIRLGRPGALKTLNPKIGDEKRHRWRFDREARAALALNHPNILTIYDFGEIDGVPYIVSEYVEGPTLRQRLAGGALPAGASVDIGTQIAAGLKAAHAVGVTHRDIKPENIVVRKDGIVKILDFGIAKYGEEESAGDRDVESTLPGTVIGTARYMSPEQARGATVDFRTDIFSLGTLLFEMISGKAPFDGETQSDVIAEILKTDPPALETLAPNTAPELSRIVRKAMTKEREQRYPSMNLLLGELRRFKADSEYRQRKELSSRRTAFGGSHGEIFGESPPAKGEKAPPRRRWIAAAAIVVLLIAAGLVWWLKPKAAPATDHPRTLAILPFRNLRPDPVTDFLGFSLADAVITKLGYVSALAVRPSAAMEKYRSGVIDLQRAGKELNVDALVAGTYVKDGGDLRITTQLIDVNSEKMLWQNTIDVKYEKLLTVQDQVAQQIISGLQLNVPAGEAQHIMFDNPIDRAAYEDYLRGVDLYALNDFSAAIDVLEKAAQLAPGYALTWAHLGRAYTTNATLQFGGQNSYDKAHSAYEKALTLNPELIESRVYMANLFTDTGRVEEAVPLLRAALQRNDNNAEAHWELGYAYRFAGMLPESVRECERARRIDPNVKRNSSALNAYLYLGDYARFLASLPADESSYVLFYRGFGEYYEGAYDKAAADFERAYQVDPSILPVGVGKALEFGIRHRNAEGLQLLKRTENKIEERGVSDAESIYKVAQAYALLGDKPAALRMLTRSVEGGFFCYPYLQADPLLSSIHDEVEYVTLLQTARRRHEQFRERFF